MTIVSYSNPYKSKHIFMLTKSAVPYTTFSSKEIAFLYHTTESFLAFYRWCITQKPSRYFSYNSKASFLQNHLMLISLIRWEMLTIPPPKKKNQHKMKEIKSSAILIIRRLFIIIFKGKGIRALNSSFKTIITD